MTGQIAPVYLGNRVTHELEEDLPEGHSSRLILQSVCPCQGVGRGTLLEHAPARMIQLIPE